MPNQILKSLPRILLLTVLPAAVLGSFVQEVKEPAPHQEIRGTVLEPGTSQPVVEAEVTLEIHGPTRPRVMPSKPKSTLTTKTDSAGSFVFRPDDVGYFNVRAKKEGYSELEATPGAPSSGQEVTLSAAEPTREVHLFLSRPCQLTGLVVDEQSSEPITGLRLRAALARGRGSFAPYGGAEGTTDAQGKFAVASLAPGDYTIEVIPQKFPKERVLTQFSQEDLKVVDRDFERTYWPGGQGADSASPVRLVSGAAVDVGVLKVKKTPYYRVHVRFPGWTCGAGDVTSIIEHHQDARSSGTVRLAEAPCGRDVLVSGLPPGAHRLMFGLKKSQGGDAGGARADFVIVDKSIEVNMALEVPTAVDGVIVGAEGSRLPDLSAVTVGLLPVSLQSLMLYGPVKADSSGKFRLEALPVEPHQLTVYGLGTGYYLKEVRYNGAPVAGDIIPLNSSALTQSLTIVLDDKPGVITGVVTRGGTPVSKPRLILAKWPPPIEGAFFRPTAHGTADDKGRFQFAGLSPGEYRLLAVTSLSLYAADAMQQALAASQKIEVSVNGHQNVTVELTELR